MIVAKGDFIFLIPDAANIIKEAENGEPQLQNKRGAKLIKHKECTSK